MFLLPMDVLRHGYQDETLEGSDKAQIGAVGSTHQDLLGYAAITTGRPGSQWFNATEVYFSLTLHAYLKCPHAGHLKSPPGGSAPLSRPGISLVPVSMNTVTVGRKRGRLHTSS